jgi:acyl transferase domain-containing protein
MTIIENNNELSLAKKALLAMKKLEEKLAHYEKNKDSIAIIGMGCRFPGGANNIAKYWDLLINGRNARTEVPKERFDINQYYDPDPDQKGKIYTKYGAFLKDIDIALFDTKFFGISPREAEMMDPQQRMLLEVVWEALEDAGIDPDKLKDSATSVYTGICNSDYATQMLLAKGLEHNTMYGATGTAASGNAGRISYQFGLQGPSLVLDTACSSSLVATHLAYQSLMCHESHLSIVSGINLILSPSASIAFCDGKMLSPDGLCKTFDESADGYGRGEGCGVVILKRLSDALKDGDQIYAVIKTTAVNQDGASSGLTVPNGVAQEKLLRQGLTQANLSGKDIDYVEAHGTGTPLGDPIEVRSLGSALGGVRDTPLMIGAVKANIGHLEAAAGVAGLIKLALMLKMEKIPPHINFKKLNPMIDLEVIPAVIQLEEKNWNRNDRIRRACISAFGFMGTNAYLIVEEAPITVTQRNENFVERGYNILPLSAKGKDALSAQITNYQQYIEEHPEHTIEDIAYSTVLSRTHFRTRIAVIGKDRREILENLKSRNFIETVSEQIKEQRIAFLFAGCGSQYSGMGSELYQTNKIYQTNFDECVKLFDKELELKDESLKDIIFGNDHRLNQAKYMRCSIFLVEYSLYKLWTSYGVRIDYFLGNTLRR